MAERAASFICISASTGGALIVATALEYGLPLLTGNVKRYRPIDGLVTETFRPS